MKKLRVFLLFLFCIAMIALVASFVLWINKSSSQVVIPEIPNAEIQTEESIVHKNTIWVDSKTPNLVSETIKEYTENHTKYKIVGSKNDAEIIVENAKDNGNIIYKKYYVPVTDFSSLTDNIYLEDLRQNDSAKKFYCLKKDCDILKDYFQSQEFLSINSLEELIATIEPDDIALISFDELDPRLKLLKIEGKNILDKEFSDKIIEYFPYTTATIYSRNPKNNTYQEILSELKQKIPHSNRDTSKLATLAMTGVTAISRGVETTIRYKNDPGYPARAIQDVLSKMDLTHIDSENPFFDGCPEVETNSLTLCGKTTSIESLRAIGTDIIDLTGNHQNDFGPDKLLESINHLEDAGFEYFGGGKDGQDAKKILYKEIGGTRIAFLGYAYFDSLNGESYRSLAYENHPGANFYSEEKAKNDIAEAKKNADFVIVDYQFTESYNYEPLPEQVRTFRATIDAGADLVVGVQAHQPQKIEFYNNKPIFYGLGNLFFDQM